MTTPTDYSTTVWESILTDLGQVPGGPDVMPEPSFTDMITASTDARTDETEAVDVEQSEPAT